MWYSAATFGDSIKIINAPIAQPVEQRPFKPKVPGSIPGGRTNLKPLCRVVLNLCATRYSFSRKSVARIEARLSQIMSLRNNLANWDTGPVRTDSWHSITVFAKL